eukprot:413000_1
MSYKQTLPPPSYVYRDIKHWEDYIRENQKNKRIYFHLFHKTRPYYCIPIHKTINCVHQLCSNIESCVDQLIQVVMDINYLTSENNLCGSLCDRNVSRKKLCNYCLLLFCIKTNKFQSILSYIENAYCSGNQSLMNNQPSIWYFCRVILSYPLIFKYFIKHSEISILFKNLIYYFEQ